MRTPLLHHSSQGPEKNVDINKYVLEAGVDVFPAVPGHWTAVHDWTPMGLGQFLRRSEIREELFYLYVPRDPMVGAATSPGR